MAQRKWLLVEWSEKKNDNMFPNYGVVNVDSITNDRNDLKPGKTVNIQKMHSHRTKRAQILRIADSKNDIKEHKLILERQDQQMRSLYSMCMRTINDMKASTSIYPTSGTNDMTHLSSMLRVVSNSDTSDSEEEDERRAKKMKLHDMSPVFPQNNYRNFNNHTMGYSRSEIRTLACSTPYQKAPPLSTTCDKGTQTELSMSNLDTNVTKLLTIVKMLFKRFLTLTRRLEQLEEQNIEISHSGIEVSNERNGVELEPPVQEQIMESSNTNPEREQPNVRTLQVRRVSAQTTNCSDPADDDMIPLGAGNVMVPSRLLREMDWSTFTGATRQLLQAVFPRRILATHSLSGKSSPAFADRPPKNRLDPMIVEDIVSTVSDRCDVPKRLVRNAITIKCTDEAKLYRNRVFMRRMLHSPNEDGENLPPSASPSSEEEPLRPNI